MRNNDQDFNQGANAANEQSYSYGGSGQEYNYGTGQANSQFNGAGQPGGGGQFGAGGQGYSYGGQFNGAGQPDQQAYYGSSGQFTTGFDMPIPTGLVMQRSIGLAILFSIITCGIYMFYWMYKINRETCILTRQPERPGSGMLVLLSIVTFGIYTVYWAYVQGGRFRDDARRKGSICADDCQVLYLVLQICNYFVGITGLINLALMQDRINGLVLAQQMPGYNGCYYF